MPVINVRHVIGERVSGAELYKQGVEEVEGKPVNIDANYSKKTAVAIPINHNRKMKKLYNKYGVAGVSAYIQSVKRHMAARKAIQQQEEEI